MASQRISGRLESVKENVDSIITLLNTATEIDEDDDFELDYYIESIEKALQKVKKISKNYAKGCQKAPQAIGKNPVPHTDSRVSIPETKQRDLDVPPTVKSSLIPCTHKGERSSSSHPAASNKIENPTADKGIVEISPVTIQSDTDTESNNTWQLSEEEQGSEEHKDTQTYGVVNVVQPSQFANDDDGFSDDDFNEDMMKEIDAVEKSITEDDGESAAFPEQDDDFEHQPQDRKYLQVLKHYFGYGKFRPLQWKIINSVLNDHRDNCVIMATGYGKSLCYQYPSVFTGGTTIVVSPLISLMEDQVLALSTVNIKACFLGSAQADNVGIKEGIMRGEYRIVYVTPEFASVAEDFLRNMHRRVGIDLIAIDEAHCVSQWGHDFRSAYRSLGKLRDILPQVPMLAVTATATPQVQKDICRSLKLVNPTLTLTGFDRPNLYLSVSLKSGDPLKDLRSTMFSTSGKLEFEGATIIYCPTKKAAEQLVNDVKRLGVKCALYHAGLALSIRKKAHKDFVNDDIQVVVATIAFGMGIDKPDVRTIIHYGAPRDIESYYQEIGRAGRDGMPSACYVFYSRGDFNTNRFFLSEIKNQSFLEHKQAMLAKMEQYLGATSCRRRCILSHFENKAVTHVGGGDNCCDNCTRKLEKSRAGPGGLPMDNDEKDYGKEARDLFNAVQITGERFGITVPIFLLRGSSNRRLPERYYGHMYYGKGKYKTEKWWKSFSHQLTSEGYMKEVPIQSGYGCTVSLTKKAHDWMMRNESAASPKLMMTPNAELQGEENPIRVNVSLAQVPKILPTVQTNQWLSTGQVNLTQPQQKVAVDPKEYQAQCELYTKLIGLRNRMSHDRGIAAFVLVSNKSLLDMAKTKPTTMENLLRIDELPVEKAHRYGKEFLEFIAKFCQEKGITSDSMPEEVEVEARMDAKLESAVNSLNETARATYKMFEHQKQSLEQVAFTRGLKEQTLINHLVDAIKIGLSVDIDRLGVTPGIVDLITDTIRKPPINSDISRLTPIKDQLPDHIQFNHIKIVIAVLQWKYGMSDTRLEEGDATTVPPPPLSRQASSPTQTRLNPRPATPLRSCSLGAPPQSQGRSATAPSSSQKRKLPGWMSSQSGNKSLLTKKMKKSSLFNK